ncbi:hypothetical protein [Idiomarina abyssalis]|uniref:hypothetical protein n=1 Tax=Idiomarina abyssalis TaxID=86102 RepID=UPI003A8CCC69
MSSPKEDYSDERLSRELRDAAFEGKRLNDFEWQRLFRDISKVSSFERACALKAQMYLLKGDFNFARSEVNKLLSMNNVEAVSVSNVCNFLHLYGLPLEAVSVANQAVTKFSSPGIYTNALHFNSYYLRDIEFLSAWDKFTPVREHCDSGLLAEADEAYQGYVFIHRLSEKKGFSIDNAREMLDEALRLPKLVRDSSRPKVASFSECPDSSQLIIVVGVHDIDAEELVEASSLLCNSLVEMDEFEPNIVISYLME